MRRVEHEMLRAAWVLWHACVHEVHPCLAQQHPCQLFRRYEMVAAQQNCHQCHTMYWKRRVLEVWVLLYHCGWQWTDALEVRHFSKQLGMWTAYLPNPEARLSQ